MMRYCDQELVDGARTFDDFLHEGLIEYIDVPEENNCLVAIDEKHIHESKSQPTANECWMEHTPQ